MRPRGVAVAGTGFIGPVHVEAVRRLGHRVVGVLGSTPAKGRAAADALGVPAAYDSFAALLADPAVEVVHLATPNRHHFEQAKAVLEAGKHVVVEKPLAMTSAETAELVRLAAAPTGLRVMSIGTVGAGSGAGVGGGAERALPLGDGHRRRGRGGQRRLAD